MGDRSRENTPLLVRDTEELLKQVERECDALASRDEDDSASAMPFVLLRSSTVEGHSAYAAATRTFADFDSGMCRGRAASDRKQESGCGRANEAKAE